MFEYRSGSKRDGGARNFACKNFGEQITDSIGTGVEEVDDQASQRGVCKIICMALVRILAQ